MHGFAKKSNSKKVVLYQLPDFRSIPISLHSRQQIFQSDTDYYKHTIKLTKVYDSVKISKSIGSVTSTRLLNYLILIYRYCNFKIYRYQLSQNSPIICCFQLINRCNTTKKSNTFYCLLIHNDNGAINQDSR